MFETIRVRADGGDSDLYAAGMSRPEAQGRISAAMERGFQTRGAELALARMLGNLG